jgi:hypothetical protein
MKTMLVQLGDLAESDAVRGMAYTQKTAERVITAIERPLNDTLLKMWMNSHAEEYPSWVDDIVNWIDEISEIVLRPANTRPRHIFYYKLLFFEPFGGGAAMPNMLRRLRRLHRKGFTVQTDVAPEALVERLQAFHRELSSHCASHVMREEQIRTFVGEH